MASEIPETFFIVLAHNSILLCMDIPWVFSSSKAAQIWAKYDSVEF